MYSFSLDTFRRHVDGILAMFIDCRVENPTRNSKYSNRTEQKIVQTSSIEASVINNHSIGSLLFYIHIPKM